MKRRIIEIDQALCNGCGLCAKACHEGAIGMVNGKAQLLRDDYCDGLGNCLPACPTGAIQFIEREAAPFDEAAVKAHMQNFSGCPGSRPAFFAPAAAPNAAPAAPAQSQLSNWPVQLKLSPISAACFQNAHLLLAADCAAYTHAGFHQTFLSGRTLLIGCPKLDGVDYTEKLAAILQQNSIQSLTVVRMQVPCCGNLERAAQNALALSGKQLPFQVVTLSLQGEILAP